MINIIKQVQSKNSMVKKGKDWDGRRIPKKTIQKSLEFESLFYGMNEVYLCNSYSDYPPSYSLSLKIKDVIPTTGEFRHLCDDYSNVMEVFPRNNVFKIRDYRVLEREEESFNPFRIHSVSNLMELIELLFNSEFSLCKTTISKIRNIKSSPKIETEKFSDYNYLRKISIETFDFNKEELKEKLIQRLEEDKINSIQSVSELNS